jgi:hypothetical protein
MTDKNKTTENRRKLLKSVAAGGGAIIAGKTLPEKWTKPAVDAVVLPAHAQTSAGTYSGSGQQASIGSDSTFARALDSLVPQAHARPPYELSWCIRRVPGSKTADVDFLVTVGSNPVYDAFRFTMPGVVVDRSTQLQAENGCNNRVILLEQLGLIKDAVAGGMMPPPATCKLFGVEPGDAFQFKWDGTTWDEFLVAGDCPPPTVDCDRPK